MGSNPNKIISLQELINAQVDAYKLELIMNEAPWVEIQTRLGRKCYSIATIQAIIDQFQIDAQKELDNLQYAIAQIVEGGVPDSAVSTWSGRTQEQKNKQVVTPFDFGAKRGRANATLNTTAFNLMFIFVETYTDTKVDLLGGTWFLDGTFNVPARSLYEGRGTSYWHVSSPLGGAETVWTAGTQICLVSNAANKVHTVHGISSMSASGGVVANPSARSGFNEANYRLETFTGTDHKPLPFSVGCKVGQGARLRGVRIYPDGGGDEGLDIYRITDGTGVTGWAANWDVGIWVDSKSGVQLDDVQAVGHWRKTGELITSIPSDINSTYPSYNNTYTNCQFGGYKPVIVRAADSFKIVAIGTNYVDIESTADHPFNVATYPYVWLHKNSFSGNRYDLIAVTENGATTRLTLGSNPIAGTYAVGSSVASRAYGGGSSQNQFITCQLHGINHASKYVCQDQRLGANAFSAPGGAIEISGYRIAEVLFDETCAWQSYENVFLHVHDAHYVIYSGWIESNADLDGNTGARIISSPALTSNTRVANPSGFTNALDLNLTKNFINYTTTGKSAGFDFRPHYPLNTATIFSGGSDNGLLSANFVNMPHASLLQSVHSNVGIVAPTGKYAGLYDDVGDLAFGYSDANDYVESRKNIVPSGSRNIGLSTSRFNVLFINDVNCLNKYNINGVPVVGARQAAITNASAGQEVAKINAILAALRTHGLIEP